MKFVALALALLLAVGSQAAPMMADAPPALQKFMDDTDKAVQDVIAVFTKVLGKADPELTGPLIAYLNQFPMKVRGFRDQITPLIDGATEIHGKMAPEIETVKEEIKPDYEKAIEILKKQYEDNKSKLIPEILQMNEAERERERVKMQEALEPLILKIKSMGSDRIEELRKSGHLEEYQEQFKVAYEQGQLNREEYLSSMREKILPHVETIRDSFQQIFTILKDTIMKN